MQAATKSIESLLSEDLDVKVLVLLHSYRGRVLDRNTIFNHYCGEVYFPTAARETSIFLSSENASRLIPRHRPSS